MITKEEVIALAKECGFGNADVCEGMFYPNFQRFAAAAYRKGVEDSAKVCKHDCECGCPCDCYSPATAQHQILKLLEE